MYSCRRIIVSVLLVAMCFAQNQIVRAQFGGIVFDPRNYIQNLYTSSRSLVQIRQQVSQLQNEARMLINQGKNLSRLNFDASDNLLRILDEITRLNMSAENVAYEVGRTKQIVREQFPEDYKSFSKDEFVQHAEAQWQMSRAAYNDAMIMQSGLVESLVQDRVTLDRLVAESQGAVGSLSVQQSGNQLLALMIKQNMAWQQMMVAGARAESLNEARRLAIEKESREKRLRFVGEKNSYNRNSGKRVQP